MSILQAAIQKIFPTNPDPLLSMIPVCPMGIPGIPIGVFPKYIQYTVYSVCRPESILNVYYMCMMLGKINNIIYI